MALVDNFQDFIKYHAGAAGMTREEYMAVLMSEAKKKPGPDPYHRGLEDDEVEDKEDQIKKQAKMDDDDPDAYKEMPGDKEAREKGEVKTSKATKAYNKIYGEDLDEGTMSDIHQMAGEVKSEEEFIKRFFKEYGAKIKKTKDSEEWAKSLYSDVNESTQINEKVLIIMRNLLTKMIPAGFGPSTNPNMRAEISEAISDAIIPILKKYDYAVKESVNESDQSDQMAYSQLERIIDYATMLRDRMAAGKGLDAWMYGKIVKAEDYLNTLYDVIDGDDGVVETQKMTNKDWKKIKKFNKHVTASGEKFVMSYDDRIGTFLEPVEIVEEADDTEQKSTDRGPLDDENIETALKKKAQDTGVPIGIIRAVMRRGLAAWKSGHRPGANQQQWGYARVNAFLTKGEGTWGGADKDLAKEVRDGGHDKKLKKA